MPLSGFEERARQRWCQVQAAIWLPCLAVVGWIVVSSPAATDRIPNTSAWSWTALALLIYSYFTLWKQLRTGRQAADWVTLARFLALLALSALVLSTGRFDVAAWSLAFVVVVSDLFDGWVARRFGASEEGAILDMETDQFTTLVLSIFAACLTGAGAWTLLLPAFKYVFVFAMSAKGLKSTDTKPCEGNNNRGRIICALVQSLLLASLFPAFGELVRGIASGLAVLLLAYSFSSDAGFLLRHSREVSTPR